MVDFATLSGANVVSLMRWIEEFTVWSSTHKEINIRVERVSLYECSRRKSHSICRDNIKANAYPEQRNAATRIFSNLFDLSQGCKILLFVLSRMDL